MCISFFMMHNFCLYFLLFCVICIACACHVCVCTCVCNLVCTWVCGYMQRHQKRILNEYKYATACLAFLHEYWRFELKFRCLYSKHFYWARHLPITENNDFKLYSFCIIYHSASLFTHLTILLYGYTDTSCFVLYIHSPTDEHLSFGYCEYNYCKINVQDSAWKPFFSNSFVYIFRGVISHKNSMFNILRTSKLFPVVAVSFLHFY